MNTYGYLLMGQGKVDSAIAIFRKNTKDYPKSWNTYDSLGEAYAKKGDKKQATASYSKALAMVQRRQPEEADRGRARQPAVAHEPLADLRVQRGPPDHCAAGRLVRQVL